MSGCVISDFAQSALTNAKGVLLVASNQLIRLCSTVTWHKELPAELNMFVIVVFVFVFILVFMFGQSARMGEVEVRNCSA